VLSHLFSLFLFLCESFSSSVCFCVRLFACLPLFSLGHFSSTGFRSHQRNRTVQTSVVMHVALKIKHKEPIVKPSSLNAHLQPDPFNNDDATPPTSSTYIIIASAPTSYSGPKSVPNTLFLILNKQTNQPLVLKQHTPKSLNRCPLPSTQVAGLLTLTAHYASSVVYKYHFFATPAFSRAPETGHKNK